MPRGGKSRYRPRYDVERLLNDALRRWHTQRDLARAAGLHERTISTWVCEGREPGYASVRAVAKLIGKDPEDYLLPSDPEGEDAHAAAIA